MPEARYLSGQVFPLQFAWRLPDGGYLRAVFEAEVIGLVDAADKYVVRLAHLLAGREETEAGQARAVGDLSAEYWQLVGALIGRRITVAYEADDGHALHMRLATLTGEHDYFTRFDDMEVLAHGAAARGRKADSVEDTPPEIGLQ